MRSPVDQRAENGSLLVERRARKAKKMPCAGSEAAFFENSLAFASSEMNNGVDVPTPGGTYMNTSPRVLALKQVRKVRRRLMLQTFLHALLLGWAAALCAAAVWFLIRPLALADAPS